MNWNNTKKISPRLLILSLFNTLIYNFKAVVWRILRWNWIGVPKRDFQLKLWIGVTKINFPENFIVYLSIASEKRVVSKESQKLAIGLDENTILQDGNISSKSTSYVLFTSLISLPCVCLLVNLYTFLATPGHSNLTGLMTAHRSSCRQETPWF